MSFFMNTITPEEAGIHSQDIRSFLEFLEEYHFSTHNIIIARGNDICFEKYYAPFHPDFLHRMYSVSKSFVSLAIGFCEQDGLLSLDDSMNKFFSKELMNQNDENIRDQTVRDMLMMSTGKAGIYWFHDRPEDRVAEYFENPTTQTRPPHTVFDYDSTGSFVLGALTERLTGKPFLDYLREKILDSIGFSKEAFCLKCPGGHSWGDSAVICKPRDLLLTARFVLNKGIWNGKQILSQEYIKKATSKQIDNDLEGTGGWDGYGYGYQFWMGRGKSFYFNGMGCQFALCIPEKDIIFIYNGDNQGKENAGPMILEAFWKMIVEKAEDSPVIPFENEDEKLRIFSDSLILNYDKGSHTSSWAETVNGITFRMKTNNAGIKTMKVSFDKQGGTLFWENEKGKMQLPFGFGENRFGTFPQKGFADEIGSVYVPDHGYKCAASGGWVTDFQLHIRVQIIDNYFGTLNFMLGFVKDKQNRLRLGLRMNRTTEDFLTEYTGFADGTEEKQI